MKPVLMLRAGRKEIGNRLVVDDVCLDNVVLSASQRRALSVQVDLHQWLGRFEVELGHGLF